MIGGNMEIRIREAVSVDEKVLAYIQTESWKAAFSDILSSDDLERSTNIEKATQMYQRILQSGMCSIAISFVEDTPHCIAAWGKNRCDLGDSVGELICIHSLQDGWRKGYGSDMMKYVLNNLRQAQYKSVILWVFEANTRARRFYEKHGFKLTEQTKSFNGVTEVMYEKGLE